MARPTPWTVVTLAITTVVSTASAAEPPTPAPCVPTARLDGDAALIAPIRASLQARGAAAGDPNSCERLIVQVLPAHPGYDLFITDADGRTDRRQLVGAETAAMVIESWLQDDLSAPLLQHAVLRGATASSGTTAATLSGEAAVLATQAPAPGPRRRSLLPAGSFWGLGVDSARDRGAALWWGASASACFRVGRLCAGPQGRLRTSAGPQVGLPPIPQQMRSLELALAVEAPLQFGRWRVSPGFSLGVGRLTGDWRRNPSTLDITTGRSRGGSDNDGDSDRGRRDGRRDDDDRPRQSAAPANALADVPTSGAFAQLAPRAGAGVGLALAITGGLALELQLAVGARPVLRPSGESSGSALAAHRYVGHAGAGLALRYGQF